MSEESVEPTNEVDDSGELSNERADQLMEEMRNADQETDSPQQNEGAEQSPEPDSSSQETVESEAKDNAKPSGVSDNNLKSALYEERQKRRELKAQLEEFGNKNKVMEEKLQSLLDRQSPVDVDAEQQEEVDPVEQLERRYDALEKQVNDRNQNDLQTTEINSVLSKYNQQAAQFSNDNADFSDAYKYLVENRVNEYVNLGYSKAEAQSLSQQDEYAIVQKSFNDNVNPAERIYGIAKIRGYASNGQQQNDSYDKIDSLKSGLSSNRSMGSVGGSESNQDISIEALANLDGDDFDEAFAKLNGNSESNKLPWE